MSKELCGTTDVRAWFAAADNYIKQKFRPHYERYKNQIDVSQGAANAAQQQVIQEANNLLSSWANYAKHYQTGGGGPVGASFKAGGFRWEDVGDANPEGPTAWLDFFNSDEAYGLSKEIVDYYDAAACLRDKFNETKPTGMLDEAPGYGSVTTRPGSGEETSEGIGTLGMIGIGVGLWVALKALSE